MFVYHFMLFTRPQTLCNYLKVITAGSLLIFFISCGVIPKDYPRNKPFVYEYKINIEGNFNKEERNDLESRLVNQLDDSIRVRTIPNVFWQTLKNPPVYDSMAADRSIIYMRALLNSIGYFRDTINFDADTVFKSPDQYRTTVSFQVKPGNLTRLDSIGYKIDHSDLQHLTDSSRSATLLKKGGAFDKGVISGELDRLVEVYRNNGYMRFSREELIGLWDTLDITLLRPTLDPFEQLEILQKLRERRENPTANLEIQLRPGLDTTRLTKYYVGEITVYPDFNRDTLGLIPDSTMAGNVKVIYYRHLFRSKIFPPNIYLKQGELYRQRNYFRTINRFNSLGAWTLVNIESLPRRDEDTVDFRIKLSPAKKYTYSANLEGSINQTVLSGNLFGIAVNLGLQNRNFAKTANRANTNLRYGVEFGSDSAKKSFIQTRQLSFSHNISFPRVIFIGKYIQPKYKENARTILAFNTANTERRLLYNLNTVNASWGYEFQWRNQFLSVRIPNVEFSNLVKRDSLDRLIDNNPSLRNIFTDGFIFSTITSYTVLGGKNNNVNVFRTNAEFSGLLLGLMRNRFLDTNLYRFIKADVELARKIQIRKTSVVLRFFGGIGYELGSTKHPNKRNNLPFFKQYFAGGPNSMRAWRLRQLGPGSVIKPFSDTSGIPDRYGDVQIEGNVEYRFPITRIGGVRLNGALFTDIGNIWFLKSAASPNPEEVFSFNRLGKDIAVGVGAGLRVDFGFFVVRLDYGYKAKDPSPSPANAASQNKWFYDWKPFGGQLQLGINYPFISDLFTR